jgi:hypothetical protein
MIFSDDVNDNVLPAEPHQKGVFLVIVDVMGGVFILCGLLATLFGIGLITSKGAASDVMIMTALGIQATVSGFLIIAFSQGVDALREIRAIARRFDEER